MMVDLIVIPNLLLKILKVSILLFCRSVKIHLPKSIFQNLILLFDEINICSFKKQIYSVYSLIINKHSNVFLDQI